jgi:WD40 repeat protein
LDTAMEMKTLSAHSDCVNSLALLSNGHLTSSSTDKTIRIWNLENGGILVKTFFAHLTAIKGLTLLPDGNLASGDVEGKIKIWHFENNSTNYSSE